jgi:hypothetical protein
MFVLPSTDLAIRSASQTGSLTIRRCFNERLGSEYWAIEDETGLIEVAMTRAEAEARVASTVEG